MHILFDCFKYTDDYYEKIKAGIADEDNFILEENCFIEKILVNTDTLKISRPSECGKYTEVTVDGEIYYILNVPFKDFLQIVNHHIYPQLKSKWAN